MIVAFPEYPHVFYTLVCCVGKMHYHLQIFTSKRTTFALRAASDKCPFYCLLMRIL